MVQTSWSLVFAPAIFVGMVLFPHHRAPTLSDANIAAILNQANRADSALGHLASQKASNANVRQFGQLMMGEHGALLAQSKIAFRSMGLTPVPPPDDKLPEQAKAAMDSLESMPKGPAWDRAYITHEVGFHEVVIDKATTMLDQARAARLKSLIETAEPVLKRHLAKAKSIEAELPTA